MTTETDYGIIVIMRVLRIEHIETKWGPYHTPQRPLDLTIAMRTNINYDNDHRPNTFFEFNRSALPNERHGFLNKRQLRAWFTKYEIRILYEADFVVRRYDNVTITAVGKKQILFIEN